jgi:hypothetical protein
VKAVARHARLRAPRAQEFITPWGTVSADDIDLAAVVVEGQSEIVEKIEEPRIEMMHCARSVIAKEMAKLI